MNDKPNFIPIQPERLPRADAVRNREVLLGVASRLFQVRDAEAVTMSEIAEEANVGKGTLYRHFPNKTSLCHALLDHEQRELQNLALVRLGERATPPHELLGWFMEQVAQFVWRNMSLLHVIGDSSAPSSLAYPAHHWWRQTIRALLMRAQVGGDIEYTTDSLYVLVDIHVLHYMRHARAYDFPRIQQGIESAIRRIISP